MIFQDREMPAGRWHGLSQSCTIRGMRLCLDCPAAVCQFPMKSRAN